jgi:hypothetical protein
MAITVKQQPERAYGSAEGQTDGNETIFKLVTSATYVVECIVTDPGTGTLKVMTGDAVPTDFSTMSEAQDGTKAANFAREVTGCSYVGLDIASGTWSVNVRRV